MERSGLEALDGLRNELLQCLALNRGRWAQFEYEVERLVSRGSVAMELQKANATPGDADVGSIDSPGLVDAAAVVGAKGNKQAAAAAGAKRRREEERAAKLAAAEQAEQARLGTETMADEGVPPAGAASAGSSHPGDELVVSTDFTDQQVVHKALVEGLAQLRERLRDEQTAQQAILQQFEALRDENEQLRRELTELKGVNSGSPAPRTPQNPRTPISTAGSGTPPTPNQSPLDTVLKLAADGEAHLSRLKNIFSPLETAPVDNSAEPI
eukprot:COSAG02_NODE_16493_length_1079_cov_1.128571_1_plen_268_part_01